MADPRAVTRIDLAPDGYQLVLADGETVGARRVVVAAGIQPFAHRPQALAGLPASLVSHTSELRNFGSFRGKEVLVIGGGQSALESAALLTEAGVHVEVLVRDSATQWLRRYPIVHSKWINWIFYAKGDVGPAGISHVVQHPGLFRRLPRRIQAEWAVKALRPAGARWLESRTRNVPIHTGRFVQQAQVEGERVRVRWDNGLERLVDQVLLGTGYRINIAQYPFLSPELLQHLDTVDGYPRLGAGFESSLPGLHFLGAPAAWSFGPLMRFVAGVEFACRRLSRRMLRAVRSQRSSSLTTSNLKISPLNLEIRPQKSE